MSRLQRKHDVNPKDKKLEHIHLRNVICFLHIRSIFDNHFRDNTTTGLYLWLQHGGECKAAELIKKGQNRDEIIQHFVRTYGERILAAPTRKGFNLTAWILPFLAILLAAGGIYVFLDCCMSSKKEGSYKPTAGNNKHSEEDKKYLQQFEKELKAFDL